MINLVAFTFQNDTSGNQYRVALKPNADGTIDGEARRDEGSQPSSGATRTTFVVLASQVSKIGSRHLSALIYAPLYNANNRAGAATALSELLA